METEKIIGMRKIKQLGFPLVFIGLLFLGPFQFYSCEPDDDNCPD